MANRETAPQEQQVFAVEERRLHQPSRFFGSSFLPSIRHINMMRTGTQIMIFMASTPSSPKDGSVLQKASHRTCDHHKRDEDPQEHGERRAPIFDCCTKGNDLILWNCRDLISSYVIPGVRRSLVRQSPETAAHQGDIKISRSDRTCYHRAAPALRTWTRTAGYRSQACVSCVHGGCHLLGPAGLGHPGDGD